MVELIEFLRNHDEKKILYCCGTMYHLLVAVLLIIFTKTEKKSVIIVSSYKRKELDSFTKLDKELKKYGIDMYIFDKKSKISRVFRISDIRFNLFFYKLRKEHSIQGGWLLINFAWSFFRLQFPASYLFKKCEKAIFIQDGATQFLYPRESLPFLLFKKVYDGGRRFWDDSRLMGIYVEHPEKYPLYFQKKIVRTNLFAHDYESNIKEIIGDIFLDQNAIAEFEMFRNVKGVIFTQPLSEDGLLDENIKIRIYEDIVRYYSAYGKVGIKQHPRDFSDYSGIGVPIMKSAIPSEVLRIMGVKYEFAIGLFTSAIDTVEANEKINIGKNFPKDGKYDLVPLGVDRSGC